MLTDTDKQVLQQLAEKVQIQLPPPLKQQALEALFQYIEQYKARQ